MALKSDHDPEAALLIHSHDEQITLGSTRVYKPTVVLGAGPSAWSGGLARIPNETIATERAPKNLTPSGRPINSDFGLDPLNAEAAELIKKRGVDLISHRPLVCRFVASSKKTMCPRNTRMTRKSEEKRHTASGCSHHRRVNESMVGLLS